MKTILHKAESRGFFDHGWLKTHHTFSFADYYNPQRIHFGALRVLNDDKIEGGTGFDLHPHKNMEVISIPLKGDLEHQDSLKHKDTIKEGEIILVTGPSGAGKTTLCSTLNRIVPEAYEGELSGEICFRGENISKYSIGKMAFKAGMLFQDPSGQLINPTVADEVAFGPENKGVPVKKIEELIDEYVGYVHMEEYLDRSPQALSGGQQQSVAYASVLAMEPEVYV